ncbi:MAG: MotE family protein, partial [Kiloniellaceae bacterium]
LKALRKSIQDLLIQHDEQVDTQFKSLVKIYESMKPKDAARIFNELDMAVLLPVVERMKERKTAPILAKMNPEKAKAITLRLADRRDLPIVKD